MGEGKLTPLTTPTPLNRQSRNISPQHFGTDPMDIRIRIRINPKIRIRVRGHFFLIFGVGAGLRSLRGTLKTRDWKTRDWKIRDQNAGVENAGLENAGPPNGAGKRRTGKRETT